MIIDTEILKYEYQLNIKTNFLTKSINLNFFIILTTLLQKITILEV